jgi:DNA polymerase-3 subunit alpha
LTQVRFQNTKKARNGNSRYVRCKLEDLSGAVECVMWPDDFVLYKDDFQENRICFVRGAVERTREEPGLILTRVLSIEQAQRELTKGLVLRMKLDVHGPHHVDALARMLQRTPGACPVFLNVVDGAGKRAFLKLSQEFCINPAALATGELEMVLGEGSVKFSGLANGNGNGRRGTT